ncbi:MAG TPA: MarR family winged helix-turn-helix transcriptional regulator [Ramlibacter sp.]|nr:MarR family winged helix-turn-helix transcriptional regulator [Ramlibacter sp.]
MPRTRPTPAVKSKASPSRPPADVLAQQAWLSVARCYHLCDAVLTSRLAALGVRLQEHEVLMNLLLAPDLTQQELANRCFVAKSGVSMLVSSMEDKGLVERQPDPQDARVRRLALTRRGSVLAARCRQVQEDVVTRMTDGQPAAVLAGIRDGMRDASDVLEAMLREKDGP